MNTLQTRTARRAATVFGIASLIVSLAVPLSYAFASVSLSIQSISPSTNIPAGTTVSFSAVTTGFTNPSFTLTDSFGGTTINSSNINSNGYFVWTPSATQVGTHNLTLTVSDSTGQTATMTQQLVVTSAATLSIQALSPSSSITAGQQLTFTAVPNGFTNPTYSVSDSFGGSTVNSSDINSGGYFSWTPDSSQTGTHALTIYASDSYGHSANTSITASVSSNGSSGTSFYLSTPYPSSSITAGQNVTFQAYPTGFTNPYYSISDSFGGTSISNSNLNSSGAFSWTPTTNDYGTHTITVNAYDSYGHSANSQTTITVSSNGSVVSTGTNSGLIAMLEARLSQLESLLNALKSGTATTTVSAPVKKIAHTLRRTLRRKRSY